MTPTPPPRPVLSDEVRPFALISAVFLLAWAAGACSDDGESSPASTTPPATTTPFEIFVTEDRIQLSLRGVFDADGANLVSFSADEQSCIMGTAAETTGLETIGAAAPGSLDDADLEQALAEIVVSCVAVDRFTGVVVDQLVPQPALEGIDRACIEREVDSLQDTPDVLAAVLRGDENGLPQIAGTAAENCS
jgi:hypothetical protein